VLAAALERGRVDALSRFGVKHAAVPLARPFPAAKAPAMPKAAPTAPHAAPAPKPGYQLTPNEEAQAKRMRGMTPDQRANELGLGRDAENARFMQQHNITPAGAPAQPSGARRFMRGAGRALGWGTLAAGGALAYGLHRQNQADNEARNLVYAPMQGSYYG
jgi:hypothetical protein